jgi:hypothetical protein
LSKNPPPPARHLPPHSRYFRYFILLLSKEHAVMNALEFVFTPHISLPTNLPFPFTVPATSTLITTTTNVATAVTHAIAVPTEPIAGAGMESPYNIYTPLGFLLYIASQLQRILESGSTFGVFFQAPTRSYLMLAAFMVLHLPLINA